MAQTFRAPLTFRVTRTQTRKAKTPMKDGITVTIDKGHLVLRMPLAKDPQLSKTSGKTRVAASTGGFMDAGVKVNGQPLRVSALGIIPA